MPLSSPSLAAFTTLLIVSYFAPCSYHKPCTTWPNTANRPQYQPHLLQRARQVNNRYIRSWNAERHARQFPIQLGNDFSNGFRGASGGWDDVEACTTTSTPVLRRRTVNNGLRSSHSVDLSTGNVTQAETTNLQNHLITSIHAPLSSSPRKCQSCRG